MTETRSHLYGRYAIRAALVGAALYLALAVGFPFLINGAPPSAADIVAAHVCCVAPVSAEAVKPRVK